MEPEDGAREEGATPVARALVIDDDEAIRELVCFTLTRDGFAAEGWSTAMPTLDGVARGRFDVIVLDANLPQTDGFAFVEKVRAVSQVPILMLTVRHEEADIVRALDLGADDYVTKPFSPRELLARVRTVMHRRPLADEVVLEAGTTRVVVDLSAHVARRSGAPGTTDLTTSEVAILRALAQSRGRPVSREGLIRRLGDCDGTPSGRSLDVHVCRIRRKVEPCPSRFAWIRTVRGLGYMLAEGPANDADA